MKQQDNERRIIVEALKFNRYASCPDGVNKRRFAAIKSVMWKRYMREWMATPDGLYTNSQIWKQTFINYK